MQNDAIQRAFFDSLGDPFTAEALFDYLPDIVFFVKDRDCRYVAVNRTLVERCGRSHRHELIGKRASEVLGETLGGSYDQQDEIVLGTGAAIVDRLELHIVRSRDIGWCLTSKLPMRGVHGDTVGIVGVSRDLRLPDMTSDDYAHIAAAVEFAQRDLSSPPSIAELADRAGMSVYQLDRRMQRVFGLTTGQWLLKTRISHASHLLVDSDQPIAGIAFAAGYADQSAFTRQFRKSTGLSPTQYRRLRRR